jgi:hypothetical protein
MSLFDDFNKELNVLKEQKNQYLHEYGAKVVELDAENKKLEANKAALLADINVLTNKKNDLIADINRDSKIILQEIVDRKNQAQEELDLLVEQKKEYEQLKLKLQETYEIKLSNLREDQDITAEKNQEAVNLLKDAQAQKLQLDSLLKEVHDEKRSIDALRKNIDKQEEINLRTSEINQAIKSKLEIDLNEAQSQRTIYADLIQKQKDALSRIEEKEQAINAQLAELKQESEKSKAEADKLIDQLKQQSKDNAFRSQELDVGFEKLQNDQLFIKRESKRLEALREEINKLRGGK